MSIPFGPEDDAPRKPFVPNVRYGGPFDVAARVVGHLACGRDMALRLGAYKPTWAKPPTDRFFVIQLSDEDLPEFWVWPSPDRGVFSGDYFQEGPDA